MSFVLDITTIHAPSHILMLDYDYNEEYHKLANLI